MTRAAPRLTKAALVLYLFAPLEPPVEDRDAVHGYLHMVWSACRGLGISEPITGITAGVDPPEALTAERSRAILAAGGSGDGPGVYSGFAFIDHDVVGLVAVMAPNDPEAGLDPWATLHRQLR